MKQFILIVSAILLSGFASLFAQNQNVSINNDGALPHNSAMLDVSSTSKGLLIPRMTSAQKQAIASPATGLIVFDTDNSNFWYFDGSQWTAIGGAGASGLITDFDWNDAANLITITENGTNWQITVDNEADDLSDNTINELSNVSAIPSVGQILKWDGTNWTAGTDDTGTDGATITNFTWDNATDLLRITESGNQWDVYIDNEADDLSDNSINDLLDVDASPASGQVLKWDGSNWVAGNDESGAGGTQITNFEWTDASNLLRITEGTTEWDVTIDNEADDLSDNIINDLSNVNASPTNGQVLKWDGSQWAAGDDNEGTSGASITDFSWNDGTNELSITEDGTVWNLTLDNDADDLSNNFLNDLNDVNSAPVNGDFLQWNGSEWVAGSPSAASCLTLEEAYNCGGAGAGRIINANDGSVEINAATALTIGLSTNHSQNGVALSATNSFATSEYSTIQATSVSNYGSDVIEPASAIIGSSTGKAYGVSGQVESTATASAAVFGNNLRSDGGYGLLGKGVNGVVGMTNYLQGYGVYGINYAASGAGEGPGVYGIGKNGVYGQTEDGQYFGVFGGNLSTGVTYNNIGVAGLGYIGVFGETNDSGFGVYANGELGSSGTKSFMIDHPTDPDNKFLKHYCAESPEVLNIYRGNIMLDSNGEAQIELPDYFDEININFSYYLTPIGGAAPNLHVKEEVRDNHFIIAGGQAGMKVSWVLYAQRNDRYVRENPKSTEVEPEKRQKGTYIHPELFGQPESKSMFKLNNKKLYAPENVNETYQPKKLKIQ